MFLGTCRKGTVLVGGKIEGCAEQKLMSAVEEWEKRK